jgi:hypothetical protein
VAQDVIVTGQDDLVEDGAQPYTIVIGAPATTDATYAAIDPADLAFSNADDDTAGITVVPPGGLSTLESGTVVTFTVVLDSEPTAAVTIPVSSDDTSEGAVSPASLVFTAANWNVPQEVTVTGANDFVDDGDQVFHVVTAASTSGDPSYAGIDLGDYTFTNVDDETAGLVATPSSGLVTTGGGSDSFQLTLASQPLDDVVVTLSSSEPGAGAPVQTTATFTAGNWSFPQTITVAGVGAGSGGLAGPYTILLLAASADPAYAGAVGGVEATNVP